MDVAALLVSVIALVLSGLALWQTKRQADAAARGTALSLEQDARAVEAAKAAGATATIVRSDSNRRELTVINRGPATARGVEVVAEIPYGSTGNEPTWLASPFPCDLAPNTQAAVQLMLYGNTSEHLQVAVTWHDERAQPQEYLARLALN